MGNCLACCGKQRPLCDLKINMSGNKTSCCGNKGGGQLEEIKMFFDMMNARMDKLEEKYEKIHDIVGGMVMELRSIKYYRENETRNSSVSISVPIHTASSL